MKYVNLENRFMVVSKLKNENRPPLNEEFKRKMD